MSDKIRAFLHSAFGIRHSSFAQNKLSLWRQNMDDTPGSPPMTSRRFAPFPFLLSTALVATPVLCLAGLFGQSPAQRERAPAAAARGSHADEYPDQKKVDPVAANGPIFVDWPKPDVALVFSGEQDGYLEPCGCAGLDKQKGGFRRRATLLKQLRDQGWPVVAVDSGGQEKRFGVQPQIKVDFALRALAKMNYAAVGLGADDLRADLLSIVINLDQGVNVLTSANVGIVDFDSGFTKRFRVVEAGGRKIGVTSVLGKKELARFQNVSDLKLLDPEQALAQVIPEMNAAGCDQLVLLAQAEADEARALARRFRDFHWVVTAHGADEPPANAERIEGTNAHLIEVGHKGMYVVVVGLYSQVGANDEARMPNDEKRNSSFEIRNSTFPFRYQRVPLDHRFADAPEIDEMHVDYQKRLETLGWEGLGLKPTAHPTGRKFAGSKICADCHLTATDVYEKSPHVHATETIVKLKPARHFDPECVSCHATGWEPQKYYPFDSGFLGLEKTPNLSGNGCENCHGPAARHVAAETGELSASPAEIEQLRAALRLAVVENEGNKPGQVYGKVVEMCMTCHDLDNSPDFDFQKYWPTVKHVGKD
jgi:hypothetical protein